MCILATRGESRVIRGHQGGLNFFPADSNTDTSPSTEILATNGTWKRLSARFIAGRAVTIALAI